MTSGIRLGSPAVTTRGMGVPEMVEIAALLVRVLERPDDEPELVRVREEVEALCRRFPLYPGHWE